MRKVLVFGTFDLLHPGHISFLKQAKKQGDFLIVIIACDHTVKKIKGFWPHQNEKERLSNVKKLEIADKVIFGKHNLRKKYDIIEKIKPNIICLGYDQKFFINDLPKVLRKLNLKTKVIRLKPFKPRQFKSSIIKKLLPNKKHSAKLK